MRIQISNIVFDAGTQIRAGINEEVVSDYAARMSEGNVFPAVVLFHDGNRYYMADGFHRGLASQRIGITDVEADVRPGTQKDALWFALGANKTNGHRLTPADKLNAIKLAVLTWPDMSQSRIAEQIGCTRERIGQVKREDGNISILPERVIGRDGKSYPATLPRKTREMEPSRVVERDRTRTGIAKRHEQLKQMAADGHTSSQMAVAVGISAEACRLILRDQHIDVPGDKAIGRTHHHSPNRIIEHIVMDAENLTADVNLIDFDGLDRAKLPAWIGSLNASRDKLSGFIRRLMKERQKDGEAA